MRKVITVVVLLIIILNLLIGVFFKPELTGEDYTETLTRCIEDSTIDSVGDVTHKRMWEEYAQSEVYCATYSARAVAAQQAAHGRNALRVNEELGPYEVWRDVYYQLYTNARSELTAIQDSLQAASVGSPDRNEFARLVVAFVQDIPYQYVVSEGCEEKPGPCNPHVAYGIYSPQEFLYGLKGDCDTRTVLLFTLLKNFGYSPLIINSLEYRHSMLALDIPSAGDDFLYKGKRYAFWETTNVGWLPGMLPPEMNNKNYWQVVLDYEYQNKPSRFN